MFGDEVFTTNHEQLDQHIHTRVSSIACVQAPPAPSAPARSNCETSWASDEHWLSLHPENILRTHNQVGRKRRNSIIILE